MILLGFESLEVDSVVVYPDHANPYQYWYLPSNIDLAQRAGTMIFTLIKYRPDAKKAGVKGGGFLTCEVNLSLPQLIEEHLKNEILAKFKSKGVTSESLILSPVLYDTGKVAVTALNVDLTNIWTATSPSLSGDNTAILSLTLDQNQATLLDEAYKDEGKPVGIAYELEFTAMRPALDVEVFADYQAIYRRFQAKFDYNIPLTEDGLQKFKLVLETQLQWLQENKSLEIKLLNLSPNDPEIEKRKAWALEYVTAQLLRDFFVRKLDDMPIFPDPKTSDAQKLIDQLARLYFLGAKSLIKPRGSLQLGYYRQEEQKTFNFRYTESKVIKQFHTPQSFFGTLLKDVPKEKPYYQQIDLDDPFFKEIEILVQAPLGSYGDIGLISAQLILRYSNDQRDLSFDTQKPGEQRVKFNMSKALDTAYQYQVQYYFASKSASGWNGSVSYQDSDWHTTEDRTLLLMPHEQMTFLNVAVSLKDGFDWNGIKATKVYLTPADTKDTETLMFTQSNSAMQRWKVRLPKPNVNNYTYKVEYVMDDNQPMLGETGTINASTLLISAPPTLKVSLRTNGIDWTVVDAVEVDLKYEDREHEIDKSEAFVFDSQENLPSSWSVRLPNPDARTYKWKATYYMSNGSEKEYPDGGSWKEESTRSIVMLKNYVPKS
ncbi:MAG: hypothetical protein MUE44_09020 [Oscillatoriaceae cyanobacterium Prado104]|jgi:hypothetical protein|nr:hypothetical protein [Oscillatoriaceae cyanobacterium Prado104]